MVSDKKNNSINNKKKEDLKEIIKTLDILEET